MRKSPERRDFSTKNGGKDMDFANVIW